jgi:hypothetical protein
MMEQKDINEMEDAEVLAKKEAAVLYDADRIGESVWTALTSGGMPDSLLLNPCSFLWGHKSTPLTSI